MSKADEKTFDVRVIERALHRGEIKKPDYEKYLRNLPDDSDNSDWTTPGEAEGQKNIHSVS
jgi:hypothetical protein